MNAVIDSVFCAATDLPAACLPYERLGLPPRAVSRDQRTLTVGAGERAVQVHFVSGAGSVPVLHPAVVRARLCQSAFFAVGLRTADLAGEITRLMSRQVPVVFLGSPFLRAAWLPIQDQAGTDLVLLAASLDHSPAANTFPLRRLDHLAAVTKDLDAKTRYWTDVLGIAPAGEVVTPTLVIRQFRLGDAVLELLGPASADSPIHQRAPGLISMASWQVDDLAQTAALARNAGFTPSDPAPGPLPGTRISTIPGTELSGVNMQLLEYV